MMAETMRIIYEFLKRAFRFFKKITNLVSVFTCKTVKKVRKTLNELFKKKERDDKTKRDKEIT